jgi:hypothetical protein
VLDLGYDRQKNVLKIKWKAPEPHEIQGQIQRFLLEIDDLASKPIGGEESTPVEVELPFEVRNYAMNLTEAGHLPGHPFEYQIRVVPLTRSGRPPSIILKSSEHFGTTIFADWFEIEDDTQTPFGLDETLGVTPVFYRSVDGAPTIQAKWNISEVGIIPSSKNLDLIFRLIRPNEPEFGKHNPIIRRPVSEGSATFSLDDSHLVRCLCSNINLWKLFRENCTRFVLQWKPIFQIFTVFGSVSCWLFVIKREISTVRRRRIMRRRKSRFL